MGHYRNIFFASKKFTSGTGSELVTYDGVVYENATKMQDFFQKYDSSQDLYVPCSACARKKYSSIMKVGNSLPGKQAKIDNKPKAQHKVKTVARVVKREATQAMPTSEKIKRAPKKKCSKC